MQKPTTPTRPVQSWTEFRADDTTQQSDAARDAEAWYDQQAAGCLTVKPSGHACTAAPLAGAWAFPRATEQGAQ